ncbi:uncharacterized protein KLLA0_D18799g [Kluyveromyces lactis]|uniref:KLLA0D18799p n=1 Tax=Kluyveromyces lactis (strain ATCC 8585 / CBS 2359 / DSM 70799 / NBRC 1267 / NRRL Y-1140 / WM37) TaxID=284590 RepID=Q6CQ95_KLULA|nr:uncharacterized protein KLLA0_D18799g [Kluyveromyces lactis]CAH00990.1 KLLA0D18799p [Kluyveromyces lactis]|eukprot:XP_453894.1 uncharacterized protein KLLA0_D18799g [Kluyveromyces lactis]
MTEKQGSRLDPLSANQSNDNTSTSKTKGRRARSNSSSNGSSNDNCLNSSNDALNKLTSAEDERTQARNKYTHVLVLKSLNNTFETKFLVVPFKPSGLKLGRPVIGASNSGSNGGLSGKADPQVKADNGNFDSRVLSRNHASLSCDAKTGKICIRDLKSSNGTFVNGSRIGQTDVEIKVGDVIDLGTDIDTKLEHRKISALVEDISVIPLIGENDKLLVSNKRDFRSTPANNGIPDPMVTITTAQKAAFEAAMFGDVNNLDLEDAVLGSETEILSGIFINNSIGTSPNLINIIKTLVTDLTLEKLEYEKLKSIDNFIVNYITKLEYLSKMKMEQADSQLVKLQKSVKQKLANQQAELTTIHNEEIQALKQENKKLNDSLKENNDLKNTKIKQLKSEVDELQTRLEVEIFKNTQLQQAKSKPVKTKDDGTAQLPAVSTGSKLPSTTTNLLLLSSISAGALAAVFKYATK